MKEVRVKKGQLIQRKGDFNSSIYQVQSGLLRSYTVDAKGKEHIFMFAPEGWIIADNVRPEKPCDLFIDALEDSIVIQKVKDFEAELEALKIIKRLEVLQKRVIMLMNASAIERYEHFIHTYPDIVQRVPQRMIASYLGITPQALSTLRAEIARK